MRQTARLHVGSVEEMEKCFGDAWRRLERGEKVACAMRTFSHRLEHCPAKGGRSSQTRLASWVCFSKLKRIHSDNAPKTENSAFAGIVALY